MGAVSEKLSEIADAAKRLQIERARKCREIARALAMGEDHSAEAVIEACEKANVEIEDFQKHVELVGERRDAADTVAEAPALRAEEEKLKADLNREFAAFVKLRDEYESKAAAIESKRSAVSNRLAETERQRAFLRRTFADARPDDAEALAELRRENADVENELRALRVRAANLNAWLNTKFNPNSGDPDNSRIVNQQEFANANLPGIQARIGELETKLRELKGRIDKAEALMLVP